MREKTTDRRRAIGNKANELMQTGAMIAGKAVFLGYLLLHNGMADSDRTKEASRREGAYVKTVATVDETWEDITAYSPDGTGYNPKVIRDVVFEDGTEVRLHYRTLAWQPFMRWSNGEEFDPQPDEQYLVTSTNQLVRRVK